MLVDALFNVAPEGTQRSANTADCIDLISDEVQAIELWTVFYSTCAC